MLSEWIYVWEQQNWEGGGLVGLCAFLAILLVGAVMGWVWTCHSKTRTSELQER